MTDLLRLFENAIRTDEMHTGGEPVRIITAGYPDIPGRTILEKRRFVSDNLDHLRRRLMWEPRGHRDMYGVIPVEPDLPGAALAVLFMHNEGYSTMCGHATLALGRWAIEKGLVPLEIPETRFLLQCPCGGVEVRVDTRSGQPGRVSFLSVPAFALALDAEVEMPGVGNVRYDLAYGGAFYAILPASRLGVSLADPVARIVEAATRLSEAVRSASVIRHPEEPDLGFLYGSILTDDLDERSRNVCIFADGQVDRSPTGSGVTARTAIAIARGVSSEEAARAYYSITGASFSARPMSTARVGSYPAVVVEVSGESHWCGRGAFVHETNDSIGEGFLLR